MQSCESRHFQLRSGQFPISPIYWMQGSAAQVSSAVFKRLLREGQSPAVWSCHAAKVEDTRLLWQVGFKPFLAISFVCGQFEEAEAETKRTSRKLFRSGTDPL